MRHRGARLRFAGGPPGDPVQDARAKSDPPCRTGFDGNQIGRNRLDQSAFPKRGNPALASAACHPWHFSSLSSCTGDGRRFRESPTTLLRGGCDFGCGPPGFLAIATPQRRRTCRYLYERLTFSPLFRRVRTVAWAGYPILPWRLGGRPDTVGAVPGCPAAAPPTDRIRPNLAAPTSPRTISSACTS